MTHKQDRPMIDAQPWNLHPVGRDVCLSCPNTHCIFDDDAPAGLICALVDTPPSDRGESYNEMRRNAIAQIIQIDIAPHIPIQLLELSRKIGLTRKTLYNWVDLGYLIKRNYTEGRRQRVWIVGLGERFYGNN